MGALLALIPIITQIMGVIPGLASILGGPGAGTFLQKSSDTLQRIFGTQDPQIILAQLAAGTEEVKAKAAQAQAELAGHLDEVRMGLADVADARQMERGFLAAGSPIAWAPVCVTIGIFVTFWGTCIAIYETPPTADNQIAFLIVGAVLTAFGGAWQYWLGSSKGSSDKDATIRTIAAQSAPAVQAAASAASHAAAAGTLAGKIRTITDHQDGGR